VHTDEFQIREAEEADIDAVVAVLREAAEWLDGQGMPMWKADELTTESIAAGVRNKEVFVAVTGAGERNEEIAGTLKFQMEDELFWPDVPLGEAAYVHRLAVRRAYAGRGVTGMMLRWAAERARGLGRAYLRLDCEAQRVKLRAMYEGFGFLYHSDQQVGPYYVARYEMRVGGG